MRKFVHIRSAKFPILPGEAAELVNEGTYGKSLAEYVEAKLRERGYEVPFICCEDWGWWVELNCAPFAFGVCIYSDHSSEGPADFVCAHSVHGPRKWSWKKFRLFDTAPYVEKLIADLITVFNVDSDVEFVGVYDEFPLWRD